MPEVRFHGVRPRARVLGARGPGARAHLASVHFFQAFLEVLSSFKGLQSIRGIEYSASLIILL